MRAFLQLYLLFSPELWARYAYDSGPSDPVELFEVEPEQNSQGLILITIDTLRADYLGAYGHPTVQTPHLERLASGGQLFRTAIAQSSTTTPSHASLNDKLYLHDHNVYSNFEAVGQDPKPWLKFSKRKVTRRLQWSMSSHQSRGLQLGGRLRYFYPQRQYETGRAKRWTSSLNGSMRTREKSFLPGCIWSTFIHRTGRRHPMTDFTMMETSATENDFSGAVLNTLPPMHMSDLTLIFMHLVGRNSGIWTGRAQYQGATHRTSDDQTGRSWMLPNDPQDYWIRPRWP